VGLATSPEKYVIARLVSFTNLPKLLPSIRSVIKTYTNLQKITTLYCAETVIERKRRGTAHSTILSMINVQRDVLQSKYNYFRHRNAQGAERLKKADI
jgi:hypothetical protein